MDKPLKLYFSLNEEQKITEKDMEFSGTKSFCDEMPLM